MNAAKAWTFLKAHGLGIGVEILVNFVLPFLIYDHFKAQLGDFNALIASSAPPVVWSVVEFIRKRRVDALSLLVIAGVALSCLAVLGGGSVKFLQLREKLVTALIGLVFLISAAIGKPLIYQLSRAAMQRRGSTELQDFEALRDNVHFKRAMTVMTLVWGGGLLAEAAVASVLVMRLSVHDYLLVGPPVGYAATGALALWTFWYSRRQRRRGQARREAEERLRAATQI